MASLDTTDLAREYAALREDCGLIDRSERGKLALTGADAVEFLNGQVTNELADLKPGEGRYAAFLTYKGKMLGDLRILAVDTAATDPRAPSGQTPSDETSELLLDTERLALQSLFDMIRRSKVGYRVELHKRTLESSLLSLIGPEAAVIAERAFVYGPTEFPIGEHDHVALGPVRLIATDVGIDVLCATEAKRPVVESLRAAGAESVSEAAAEIVRVEHGSPRFGVDIDESTIPQEAGLNERAVSFAKGCYVGQETVARLYYKGRPNRRLRGLYLPAEPHPQTEPGTELKLGDRLVGHVGSSVVSPTLGRIGLALLRREAEPRATLTVGVSGATATVVELPFQ
ncbi:MAG TPA: glycine cleavage T C-terminal barrel domain-containing protein [Solirubrobacteraceae bacterium]|nr:glycine cleavage T C-terminal barrel domain-containing protein [Solirubrobacteraceae bacterium]